MFLYTIEDQLISKIVKVDDRVLPSPNSVMAHNLFRLELINYHQQLILKSKNMLASVLAKIQEHTNSYSNLE